MENINILALKADYTIHSILAPTNIQWTRKYYEPGKFTIQIPLSQYGKEIAYIYTKDRPEFGTVTQRNYVNENGYSYMLLSGYFLENELNKRVVYQKGITNITNGPTWLSKSGDAESVAFAFFNAFKDLEYTDLETSASRTATLGISQGTNSERGNNAVHTRNGEDLGSKVRNILKPSGMAYKVTYDFDTNEKIFNCWSGVDRTNGQSENNPITFSTRYGNIKNPNILIDETDYKNAVVQTLTSNEQVYTKVYSQVATEQQFVYNESSINKEDYSAPAFDEALCDEARELLNDTVKVTNVEFDAVQASYQYMTDFDLGDKCSIEIAEMELSLDARLIGIYEVIKNGQHTMTLEFGDQIIRR